VRVNRVNGSHRLGISVVFFPKPPNDPVVKAGSTDPSSLEETGINKKCFPDRLGVPFTQDCLGYCVSGVVITDLADGISRLDHVD